MLTLGKFSYYFQLIIVDERQEEIYLSKKKGQEETNNGAMNFNEWCTLFLGGHIKENVV